MPDGSRGDRITFNTGHDGDLRKQRRGRLPTLSQATMRPKGDPRSPAALSDPTVYGTRGPQRHRGIPVVRTETSETGGAEAALLLPLAAWAHGLRMMTNGSWEAGVRVGGVRCPSVTEKRAVVSAPTHLGYRG
jgi:hypothetical protein